jgi:hypothetical protein
MQVHAVHDELDGDARVLQESEGGARVAVVQWGHRVEQVGGASVTIRTEPRPAASNLVTADGSGGSRQAGS